MQDQGDLARFRIGPPGVGFDFTATFHPDGAQQVLTDRSCVKEAPAYTALRDMIGDGLVASNGERWQRDRRVLQPLFTRQRAEADLPVIAGAAEALVGWCAPAAAAGQEVDLHDVSMHYALQALGATIFGQDIDEAAPVVRTAVPIMQRFVARRAVAPVRIPRWIPTPSNRAATRAKRLLDGYVEHLITERSRRTSGSDDLLGRLLAARDPDSGEGLPPDDVRDQVATTLVAGHETTGGALAFALHLLSTHPDVQERVHDEVEHVLGDRRPVADDLAALRYTGQVVQESLRLFPSLHTLLRRTTTATTLLGRQLPADHIVAVSVWGIHHRADLWPDPFRFDPGRFDEGSDTDRHRYQDLAFGGGPRTCIGAHLAAVELTLGIASMVRSYRMSSELREPVVDAAVSIHPVGGLPARLEAR